MVAMVFLDGRSVLPRGRVERGKVASLRGRLFWFRREDARHFDGRVSFHMQGLGSFSA